MTRKRVWTTHPKKILMNARKLIENCTPPNKTYPNCQNCVYIYDYIWKIVYYIVQISQVAGGKFEICFEQHAIILPKQKLFINVLIKLNSGRKINEVINNMNVFGT